MSKGHEVIPSARRLITSLRDIGYDFSQAVADIVDNSVEAKATHIRIDVEFDGDDSWVRIADNGHGMSSKQLLEAMRYGAERDYGEEDLGKFGLGLKTASMSQCRRLTVASRHSKSRAQVSAFAWDLEHIERTNKWEVLSVARTRRGPELYQLLEEHTGTVVLWQRLDRILGSKHPYGEMANRRLAQMCREIETHLAMVLHRFLGGQHQRKLRITLNGNDIQPWDPFCRAEAKTEKWEPFWIQVDEEGAKGSVRVEPYILPHEKSFSSPNAHKRAAGPNGWNQQQGFYIYRAGRMIQSGGWSRLRAPDEHTKLARVALSFSPNLDDAFKVNVAKMRAQIPASIRDELSSFVQKFAKTARQSYDRKEDRSGVQITSDPPVPAGLKGKTRSNGGEPPKARLWSFAQWSNVVLGAATRRERPSVEQAIMRAAKQEDESLSGLP